MAEIMGAFAHDLDNFVAYYEKQQCAVHTAKENWKEWKEKKMIIEILELAAALEWIALGVLVFFKLRSLKRQAEVVLETLDAAAWKSIKQEEEVWRKNTPNEIRAAFGFPPITPTEYTEMKIREETDR